MKKFTILLMTAFMAFAFNGWGQIISQYIETNSGTTPKGIEIWNNTAGTLDFSANNLVIEKGTNGAVPSEDFTLSSTTLASGDCIVIGTTDMETTTVANGSVFHLKAFTFNGDDALVVKYGGTITDVFGEPGTGDPGTGWSGNGVQTWNQNIGLKAGITTGDVVGWTDPSIRFETISTDPFGDGPIGFGIAPVLGGNLLPEIANVVITPSSVLSSSTVSVSADVTDADGSVDLVELSWGTTSGALTTFIGMSLDGGDTYTTDTDIPAQANGTTVYYQIYAEDDTGDDNSSLEMSYTVTDPATTTLPYAETFDADLGACYPYSVTGATKEWYWDIGGYAYMSGYNSGITEEDWLVLPGINLDDYSNEFMTFDTWWQYGTDDENNYLKLYYSTDYSGVGDPTTAKATWTELPYNQPSASQVWESSGYVDLTGISGTMVYIAFKYNYEVTKYRNWGVDNISISEFDLIDWANLQYPGSGAITVGGSFTVYAQAYEPGVTDLPGQGAGLVAWIGYSTADTDPSTWTDWVLAPYFGESGNNDEYSLDLGLEILTTGTYYYASRFQLGTVPYQYGGFSGGFWDGVTNVSGVLTINPPSTQIDWANLQWPPDGIIDLGGDFNVYAQVYEPGVTDLPGPGAGISAWIGYSTTDSDPATWTDWIPASFNTDNGDNDEYMANLGASVTTTGIVYYASRFKLDLADYVYGGFNSGFWDGTINVSGELTVNAPYVMINEVDADQDGTDDQEFIELYDGGAGNTNLSGLVVVLYNGSDNKSYLPAIDLDGEFTNAEGYYVLGSALVPNVDTVIGIDNIIQNGADAVALHIGDAADFPNDTDVTDVNLIDAIVYGTNDGDALVLLNTLTPGELQVNESSRGNSAYHSNQRIPNGSGGLRMTGTYDQAFPTSGVENAYIWNGANGTTWDDDLNWVNPFAPTATNVVLIEAGMPNYPEIAGTEVECTDLEIETGASVTILPLAGLNATGTVLCDGDLLMASDASGNSSSFRDGGIHPWSDGFFTYVRKIEPYDALNDELGWHYIASPIEGFDNWDMFNYWINTWNEPASGVDPDFPWVHMEGSGDCVPAPQTAIGIMEGWSVRQDYDYACGGTNPGTGDEIIFSGLITDLHSGNYDRNYTALGGHSAAGYNLMGNPYASFINMDAFTGLNVHIWDGSANDYLDWADGGDFTEIPPTQGFFVYDGGDGNVALTNANRVFGSQPFEKSTSNQVVIRATGNDKEDKTYIRFSENATADYDNAGMDAYKLLGTGIAPQIYTVTNGEQFSINTLAETPIVPMSFFAAQSTSYTIEAIETGDFANVILEDRFYGVQTDLLTSSYTFNYNVNDDTDRFFIHFTPLSAPELSANSINMWSNDHKIYVQTPEISGDIVVYNMMGQEVSRAQIQPGLNVVPVADVNAFYVVKITGSEVTKTGKVYVK